MLLLPQLDLAKECGRKALPVKDTEDVVPEDIISESLHEVADDVNEDEDEAEQSDVEVCETKKKVTKQDVNK